ncbi:short-chain collagen C4-like [Dysidea avara]|uniref:short-chain collagen C4-like n=1 Tax=Dysidea avara TaxID=196820 RepID=UPI00332AC0C9
MPCSLCEATGRSSKIMIPSHYVCPDGWHKEYNGYSMAGHYNQEGSSMYYCIDKNLEQIPSSGDAENVQLFYTVRTTGSYVPGDGYALPCVVCTK